MVSVSAVGRVRELRESIARVQRWWVGPPLQLKLTIGVRRCREESTRLKWSSEAWRYITTMRVICRIVVLCVAVVNLPRLPMSIITSYQLRSCSMSDNDNIREAYSTTCHRMVTALRSLLPPMQSPLPKEANGACCSVASDGESGTAAAPVARVGGDAQRFLLDEEPEKMRHGPRTRKHLELNLRDDLYPEGRSHSVDAAPQNDRGSENAER